ncbi:MAG: response regulator [Flavobacteriaceae bacterium]
MFVIKNYFLCFFLIPLTAIGQVTSSLDSLKSQLNTNQINKFQAQLNLDISKTIENKDRDSSLIFAKNAAFIAFNIQDQGLLSKSYLQEGIINFKQKKDDQAILYFNKIDSLYAQNNTLYDSYFMSKIYRSEVSKFTFTLEGVLQAKTYILEALDLAKSKKDNKLINQAIYRLAEWHGFMSQEEFPIKHLDSARNYIYQVLPYYQSKKDYKNLSKLYYTMASIEMELKNYSKATDYYNKRLQLIKKTKDSILIGEAYYSFGTLYRKLENPNKGLIYLDSAAVIFNKTGFSSDGRKKDLYKDYAYIYEAKKDYKNAFENMYQALLLKDTIYENENNKRAMELEKKYQTKQKEQEIALLKSQNLLAVQQQKNQRNTLLAGIIFTSLLGLIFFFLYRNRQITNQKLKELDKAKSIFFANISHELRTPLTLISGPIQQLIKKKEITDDERSNIEMIQRNSTRLINLVDQLLDISKIEAGNLKLKVSNNYLKPFVGTLTDGFTYAAKQKEIEYNINNNLTSATFWFDKNVVEKIILNLLSNAIKYTPNKGVTNCIAQIKDSYFYFEVKNSGPGLSAEEQTKIFERFYQLNENKEGVGIGLALVKELVSLHHGKISVNSIPDKETIFTVNLPIKKSFFNVNELIENTINDQENVSQNPLLKQTLSLKIKNNSENNVEDLETENPILLLVDDEEDVRNYVYNIFKKNYTILLAKNGQEGIDLAIKHIPDVIISDIMMPKKTGVELCNILKNDEHTSHIPIILLTAKTGEENEIEGIKTGADAYITKPFNEDLLHLKINHLIDIRKKLQERYSQEIILKPKNIAVTSIDEIFLGRVQKVLDSNLLESSFNITDFSNIMGMSRMQLHRKLKALTGLSATEFIKSQRLKLAAQLLKKSEINVSQVGYSVGFNDHAYFSKCFKKMFDCTPSEYTKNKHS